MEIRFAIRGAYQKVSDSTNAQILRIAIENEKTKREMLTYDST